MEKELEVKILGMDMGDLKKKVLELGAEKLSEEKQVNLRINSSRHPIDPEMGYLRLRRVEYMNGQGHKELTFKAKKENKVLRNYSEFTTRIENEEALLSILEILGYDQISRGEKHRESYGYKGARFDFDTWDKDSYPDPYMEIEVEDESQFKEIIQALEIPEENISRKSIGELRADLKK